MVARPRRSVLYMPGSNAEGDRQGAQRCPPTRSSSTSRIRSRPTPRSRRARRSSRRCAKAASAAREVVIRVNGAHTPWGEEDLAAAIAAAPDAILLPKVDGPGAIMLAARALRDAHAPEKTRLWAMMETPMAILSAGSIAATAADPTARLEVLVMGLNDLAKETRARLTPGRAAFSTWLALCVAAARAHGCDILDGVYNDIEDLDGFRAECEQGREMGLDGKTLIHPSQIDICNEVFAPSAGRGGERARDHRGLRAARKRRQGRDPAQRPDGRTCCTPNWRERTLAIADGIAALAAA